MKKTPWYKDLQTLKEWWWLLCLVAGAVIVWGNLPTRMAKAEQQIDDLKGWAKEIQGYTRAMNQQQRQSSNSSPNVYDTMRGPISEWDAEKKVWWCCDSTTDRCWNEQTWYVCPGAN